MLPGVVFSTNIVACGEDDIVETEALIFMFSALGPYWKYLIGYVLIDKINADDFHCLLPRTLQLSLENNLKVRTGTCDGTVTNFKLVKLFGCKIRENMNDINGTFTFPGYSYDLFFTPDTCHMLKLARNALNVLKVLLDADNNPIQWKFVEFLHLDQLKEGYRSRTNCLMPISLIIGDEFSDCRIDISSSAADANEFSFLLAFH